MGGTTAEPDNSNSFLTNWANTCSDAGTRTFRASQALNQRYSKMATVTSTDRPGIGTAQRSSIYQEIRDFWQQFFVEAFNPYRPELHYMRGPGPAWRAKHGAPSPDRN